jgi:hypothetical protein
MLFGESGMDYLYGGLGSDTLDGGYDGFVDQLFGNAPNSGDDGSRDTFVFYFRRQQVSPTSFVWVPANEEAIMDFAGPDVIDPRYMWF